MSIIEKKNEKMIKAFGAGFRKISLVMMIRIAFVLIIILSSIQVPVQRIEAAGNNYYVSKEGSDSNSGSEASPWLTIQKAAATMTPGDTCFIKKGIYNEQVRPVNSGLPGLPITYCAYPGDVPIIDGIGVTYMGYHGLFDISNSSYITVRGLTIRNAPTGITGMQGVGIWGTSSDILLKDLTIYNIPISAIHCSWSTNSDVTTLQPMYNITIDGCTFYNTNTALNSSNLVLLRTIGFEIKNCIGYDSKLEGLAFGQGCQNGSIHDCEVYNCLQGIYINPGAFDSDNITIYNNRLHNNTDYGIAVGSEHYGNAITNLNIYNNLIYNNGLTGGGIAFFQYFDFYRNFSIINNTLYKNGIGEIYLDGAESSYKDCVVRNNIIVGQNSTTPLLRFVDFDRSARVDLSIDHNLFYDAAGYYAGNVYGTNYLKQDPLLTNPAGMDFSLQNRSPAIDAGSSTGAPSSDYAGNTRPQNAGYDIGAYESTAANLQLLPNPDSNKPVKENSTWLSFFQAIIRMILHWFT